MLKAGLRPARSVASWWWGLTGDGRVHDSGFRGIWLGGWLAGWVAGLLDGWLDGLLDGLLDGFRGLARRPIGYRIWRRSDAAVRDRNADNCRYVNMSSRDSYIFWFV
ncbi:MAG: hypothetical protein ACI9ME_001146 [Ilumatobacter sp.]